MGLVDYDKMLTICICLHVHEQITSTCSNHGIVRWVQCYFTLYSFYGTVTVNKAVICNLKWNMILLSALSHTLSYGYMTHNIVYICRMRGIIAKILNMSCMNMVTIMKFKMANRHRCISTTHLICC